MNSLCLLMSALNKPRAGLQHRPSADNRIQAGFYNSVLVWVICFYGKTEFILSETFFFFLLMEKIEFPSHVKHGVK